MAVKPETLLTDAIHKHLDSAIYREKMSNPYRSGTPDFYYEGPNGTVLWVEYKHFDKLPRVFDLTKNEKLTSLQDAWLTRAHNNDVLAWVVAGVGKGRERQLYIFEDLSWKEPIGSDKMFKFSTQGYCALLRGPLGVD